MSSLESKVCMFFQFTFEHFFVSIKKLLYWKKKIHNFFSLYIKIIYASCVHNNLN